MDKNKGGGDVRNHRSHDVTGVPSLKDLGIEKTQSMRWQQIADELGVHRNTVAADLCTKNSVRTEKVVHKQPRTRFKRKPHLVASTCR